MVSAIFLGYCRCVAWRGAICVALDGRHGFWSVSLGFCRYLDVGEIAYCVS